MDDSSTVYGYARVSTHSQSKDGNSLEAQERTLRDAGAQVIFCEEFTGTKTDRPELDRLLDMLKGGDTIMVTKLDRIARSTEQGIKLINDLLDRRINVHILNIGKMDNTPSGKLIRTVFLGFAEFEHDMIIERTREGKAIARQNPGFREGRPKKYNHEQIEHALSLLEDHSYTQVEKMTGISKSTLIRAKKEANK